MINKQEEQEDKDKEEKSPRVSTQQKMHKTPSLVYSTPENDLRKTVKSQFTANTQQQNNTQKQIQQIGNIQQTRDQIVTRQKQQQQQQKQQQQQSQQQSRSNVQGSNNPIMQQKTQLKQNDQELQSMYFENTQKSADQDPLRASIQKDNFETDMREILKKLDQKKQIINPLQFVITQNINASNPDVLFYVLSDQMRKANREFFKSLEPHEKLLYSFQGQFTADQSDCQTYSLILQDTPSLNYNLIESDPKFKEDFIKKLTKCLSKDLKVKENQIQIIALKKGSTVAILQILNNLGEVIAPFSQQNLEEVMMHFPGTSPSLSLYEYFQTAALSADDFDPNYNMLWNDFVFGNYDDRGPQGKTQPYFFPVGWHGYGLNVAGKYGNNDNWLKMDNNKEEWYVMFHGTNFRVAPNILKQGFKTGSAHSYEFERCLLTNKEIGKGVYFSNHVEVAEGYAEATIIGNEKFVLAFQSRVRPEALRQCKKASDLKKFLADYKKNNKFQVESLKDMKMWDNDYFVVNNTRDIRPYRILIKKLETRQ